MPHTLTLPNPSRPRALQPARLITDRAKRYRATKAIPTAPKRCVYCGAPRHATRRLDVEHIDGHEANTNPGNLAYACRSCNTRKGKIFRRHKIGKITAQYNPRGPAGCGPGPKTKRGIEKLGEYVWATQVVRGFVSADCREIRRAASLISHTPADQRSSFAKEIWRIRKERGTGGREY